jgi:VCBS repeat-containing protein
VSQPVNGTLSLSPGGSFAYTPEAGYAGVDSFTYRAYDGSAYSPAVKVTITVAAPAVHAPVARSDSYETNSGTTLTVAASGVLANDTDAQGHALIASTETQPAHGTLSFRGDGSFVYVPAADYSGSDSFTYLTSDGTAVSSASVTISVVDPSKPPSTVVHRALRVYRFLNRTTSVHFYTASEAEKANVVDTLSSTYSLEGVAYSLDTSAAANTAPLYRFYNIKKGVHFYTASPEERDTLLNTMGDVYRYDGVACNISLTPAGSQPVYRFYNIQNGVHFYTASLAERDSVESRLSGTYRYEGIAYYYAP